MPRDGSPLGYWNKFLINFLMTQNLVKKRTVPFEVVTKSRLFEILGVTGPRILQTVEIGNVFVFNISSLFFALLVFYRFQVFIFNKYS